MWHMVSPPYLLLLLSLFSYLVYQATLCEDLCCASSSRAGDASHMELTVSGAKRREEGKAVKRGGNKGSFQ